MKHITPAFKKFELPGMCIRINFNSNHRIAAISNAPSSTKFAAALFLEIEQGLV